MSDPRMQFARRVECEECGMYFNRYFFKQRFGSKMVIGRHHHVVQAVLDRTMLPPDHPDFISRLIVNVPPGYTKTEQCVMNYAARGMAINPSSRFLHLSYSQKLALNNSATIRSIVKSQEFQQLWPIGTKADTDSKEVWHTEKQGGVTASPAGGQITGFRAGHMDYTQFTGALIIDDPLKPDEANSEIMRAAVNQWYNETVASRLAIETIPIIVVMQRLHWNDLCGYLLGGGSGEKWHHLNLPVIIDSSAPYPEAYTHGVPIDHGLPDGWLWSYKHNDAHERALRAHRRRFAAQYMQSPIKRDEALALWSERTIATARSLNWESQFAMIRTIVAVDPATTNNSKSDEHGIIVASSYIEKHYSIDADYTCKGSPLDWALTAVRAAEQHDADAIVIETNQGGDMCEQTLRNAGYQGRIIKVHAVRGKVLRAEPIAALYEQGLVEHKAGLLKCEDEMLDLDPLKQTVNGRSPNRVDALVYALTELSGKGQSQRQLLQLATGTA